MLNTYEIIVLTTFRSAFLNISIKFSDKYEGFYSLVIIFTLPKMKGQKYCCLNYTMFNMYFRRNSKLFMYFLWYKYRLIKLITIKEDEINVYNLVIYFDFQWKL